MKKIALFALFVIGIGIHAAKSQAYVTPRFVEPDYVTITSTEGIGVSSVTPNGNNSYIVTLVNNNRNEQGEIDSYCFEWYLSYKDERVTITKRPSAVDNMLQELCIAGLAKFPLETRGT